MVLGVTRPPTHSPIRNGLRPHRSSFSRRITSQAQISAAARWNCWMVSSRSVYRMMTATPCSASSPPRWGLRLRMASVKAVRPRYASVLPPPVGNQRRSASAVWSSARSGWPGSASEGRLSRRKASWKGRQLRFFGRSAAWTASWSDRVGVRRRSRAAMVWTRWCHMARLANRKASSASGSSRNRLMPAWMRSAVFPARRMFSAASARYASSFSAGSSTDRFCRSIQER